MTPEPDTGSIHDQAAGYAVHALTGAELSEFEAHLHDCERCRAEVRDFAEALAALSGDLEVAPPPAVRTGVLEAIAQTPQLAPVAAGEPGRPRHAADGPGRPDEPAEKPADELAAARERREQRQVADRPRRGRAWIAVAAAAAVIAVGAGGWAVNLHRQLDRQQQSQVAGQQLDRRVSALLNASDAKVHSTKLNDGTPVSYVVSKKLNTAMLVGTNVSSPGADRMWQLWTVGGSGTPSRDQTFVSGSNLRVFMTGDIDNAAALAITVEKAGSTPTTPSMPPFAIVKV